MIQLDANAALVLFSGGQDSATCLAWALERYARVETVAFHYGQRHAIEMEVREPIRRALRRTVPRWAPRLGADHVVSLDVLGRLSRSALTSDLPAAHKTEGLPATFVPGRNLVFFTFAAILAYQRDIKNIVAGVCETDYSGYPDCRDDTVKAMQTAVNLGMESRIVFHTPLMWLDKAATWRLADDSAAARWSSSSAPGLIPAMRATASISTTGAMAAAPATPVGCAPAAGRDTQG